MTEWSTEARYRARRERQAQRLGDDDPLAQETLDYAFLSGVLSDDPVSLARLDNLARAALRSNELPRRCCGHRL